ncbi:hypothetical protein [Entomobacter blattae]|uniref:Uncharacterized protein n=1 Tax=Entomobacter blattae TaxID=2762277 RepID=A0A7H1NUK6_9PROT|nr:hypothetical protein [Entomobacter blattae]QNT79466.1 hypothetical protein JGUZn3_22650 [Entomobacter blattae]
MAAVQLVAIDYLFTAGCNTFHPVLGPAKIAGQPVDDLVWPYEPGAFFGWFGIACYEVTHHDNQSCIE